MPDTAAKTSVATDLHVDADGHILLRREPPVATVTINRPAQRVDADGHILLRREAPVATVTINRPAQRHLLYDVGSTYRVDERPGQRPRHSLRGDSRRR